MNLAAVPSAQRATVLSETKTAVARVAGSTGFTFSYKGYTTEVPTPGSMTKQTAELVVAYSSPTRTKYDLSGAILGQGGYDQAMSMTHCLRPLAGAVHLERGSDA